jgi:uncharacterized protein YhdP
MNPERARRRRFRRWLLFSVAGLLIVAAAIIGGMSLMFPWLLAHPERVQQFLAERMKRPVAFAALEGEWLPGGPVFRISGLRIGGDADHPVLELARAELAIDFYAPFKRGVALHELRIIGLDIDAERDAEGRFRIVQWRGSNDATGDPLDALRALGAFRIAQSRLRFHDLDSGTRVAMQDVDIAVGSVPGGQRILGRVRLAAEANVVVHCDLAADFRSGDCFASATNIDVSPALDEVQIAGVALTGGQASLQMWLRIADARINAARIELDAEKLSMRGQRGVLLGNGEQVEPRYSPEATRLAIDWQRGAAEDVLSILEGPSLDADDPARSKLRLRRGRSTGAWVLSVEQLVLDRVLPWLSLGTRLSPAAAGWIFEAAPGGRLHDLRVSGSGREIDAINGRVQALALQSTRRSPRIAGLDASLFGDAQAVLVRVRPVETVVDFPGVFRAPLPVLLEQVEAVVARTDDGILVEFPELAVQGEGFGIDGRLALKFVADGGRPEIESVMNVRAGSVLAAKAFVPINITPRTTRDWIDRALVAGEIVNGIASIRGDLDHWPFRKDEGIATGHAAASRTPTHASSMAA